MGLLKYFAILFFDVLDFYHQRVLGIRENQTLEVTINNMDRGNLVHEILESLYLPYQNKVLKASDFDDFLIATLLADLFDPSGSEDLELVSKKIVFNLTDLFLIIIALVSARVFGMSINRILDLNNNNWSFRIQINHGTPN